MDISKQVEVSRDEFQPGSHGTAVSFSFPQASNQTLLDKFKRQHEGNSYIEFPAVMEPAFIIRHYAGKVKYGVKVRCELSCIGATLQPSVCLSTCLPACLSTRAPANILYSVRHVFYYPLLLQYCSVHSS